YPHLSWLVLTILFAIYVAMYQRGKIRRAWEGQPNLNRPHTFDIIVSGVTVTTPVSRHEYQWDAFPKFLETPHLFLLYISNLTFHLIPKRAFANDAEMEACRNMFKNLISTARPGFA